MIGLPLPTASRDSSTLHVFARASTNTNGSRAITGAIAPRNCLTNIAVELSPAQAKGQKSQHFVLDLWSNPMYCHPELLALGTIHNTNYYANSAQPDIRIKLP